jgi:hypothetical protein
MHKKGITEEVAKKRSRRTVKHQRGIVGADLAAIAAKRNQTAAVRSQARLNAITKAKTEKKEKEVKKAKVRFVVSFVVAVTNVHYSACSRTRLDSTQGFETANEGWQGWPINSLLLLSSSVGVILRFVCHAFPYAQCYALPCIEKEDSTTAS